MLMNNALTPQDITRMGEDYYFSNLQSELEPENNGKYIVIEVESHDYFVDRDIRAAITKAQEKYPAKLFYIAVIGSVSRPQMNNFHYAWQISK